MDGAEKSVPVAADAGREVDLLRVPAPGTLPMVKAQRSGITIGDPFVPFNVPRAVSLARLKTLISPLPLLPTSKSPARAPNDVGAMASPHGWSSDPPVPTRDEIPRRTKSIHDTRFAIFIGDVNNAV